MLLYNLDDTGKQILLLTIFTMLLLGGIAEFIKWIRKK